MKLLVFSLFFVFVSAKVPSTYSDWYARHKFYPLGSIGGEGDGSGYMKKCFNNGTFLKHVNLNCDLFHNDSSITCAGSLAVSHDDEAIIIAFRPTVGCNEYYEEFDFVNLTVPFPGGGTVSFFYNHAAMSVWKNGIKDAYFTVKNQYPSYETWVTGHSMGGGMSAIMAAYLIQMQYASPGNVKMMTFGEMRVGHPDFADRFPSLVPWAYRVVHRNDSIPHMITPEQGYKHHKNEVWYKGDMSESDVYVECDEEEGTKCSDSVPPQYWTHDDHMNYFQHGAPCEKGPGPGY